MKLLSINLARSIWLFHANDLNPRGKDLYPAIELLINLYKFKTIPSQAELSDPNKEKKFGEGEFINSEGESISINFIAYNDGILADTRSSTRDTDDFLDDLLTKLLEKFSLANYKEIAIKKAYVSQVYFTTEKHLETLNPKLKDFSSYLTNKFSHPYELGNISFWADQISPINPPLFTFERVVSKPFSEKRYYSSSGLQTKDHLDLLSKLEDILGT